MKEASYSPIRSKFMAMEKRISRLVESAINMLSHSRLALALASFALNNFRESDLAASSMLWASATKTLA